jgi:hypothetical protein
MGETAAKAEVASARSLDLPRFSSDPMPSQYEQILARTQKLKYLGYPRSWSVVRQGFLPIAPERVLILEPEDVAEYENRGDRWAFQHRGIRERLTARLAKHRSPITDEQLALCVRLVFELTQYYSVPEHFEGWAVRMAAREWLGSTGIGGHVAVPHQYQVFGHICTANSHVDWWLILFPQGTDCWDSLDEKPVHVMFTHVYARPSTVDPCNYIWPLSLLSQGLWPWYKGSPDFALALSRMDRISAARHVNRHVVLAMEDES